MWAITKGTGQQLTPLMAKNSSTDRTEWEGSLLWQKNQSTVILDIQLLCRHHRTSAQKCWLTVYSDRMHLWCIIPGLPTLPLLPPQKKRKNKLAKYSAPSINITPLLNSENQTLQFSSALSFQKQVPISLKFLQQFCLAGSGTCCTHNVL